jgi:hypothetical protein
MVLLSLPVVSGAGVARLFGEGSTLVPSGSVSDSLLARMAYRTFFAALIVALREGEARRSCKDD